MNNPIGLFQAYGIEIELMIVESKSLDVKPCADQLLTAAAGSLVSDFEDGDITWSNELVSHVIEFKTTGPAPSLDSLESSFFRSQQHAREILATQGLRLMPTGMHPWMNPETETVLWPHDNNEIYSLYDRIFDCRGHGWSNLQSVHINLPFANEDEFKRLHTAIRALLPILPAIGASTPFSDGKSTGLKDTRLSHYELNQKSVPIITGDIIPESVNDYADYRKKITDPIQVAIRPHDPTKLLEGDWLNSRGAIARIDRGTIEIRLLDTQECAHADITLVQLIATTLRSLVNDEVWLEQADRLDTKSLRAIWKSCVVEAEQATIDDPDYVSLLVATEHQGRSENIARSHLSTYSESSETMSLPVADESHAPAHLATAAGLWRHLFNERVKPMLVDVAPEQIAAIERLLARPSLATRIEIAAGDRPSRNRLREIYETLCDCLDKNEVFDPKSLMTEKTHGPNQKTTLARETTDSIPHV